MARKPRPPTQEEIIRERWLRGRLDYKLHVGQRKLKEKLESCRDQLFVNECARQFGKSYFWVTFALAFAHANPGVKIKYGTAFHSDLIEFIMPTFDAVMEDCPDNIRPKYRTTGSKFIAHNGSEIKLVGLDKNPNGLRGNVIDLIILDEAGFITNLDYLYKSVIIPATTHRPNCRVVFSSTPPSTPAHPFLDYVEKAEYEGSYVKMTIYDNPMVDKKTIERLKKESGGEKSTTWRREYLCEHVTDQDLAIIPEWCDEYVKEIPKDDYYGVYHKYDGMDLGVRDHTAVIFGYYEFLKARLVIEDEYVIGGPELTTEILQRQIKVKERELGWSKTYLRVSDSNNPLLLQDLSYLHQLHFVATDKGSIEEMVNMVRLMVSNGQIIVHPRCKQLIGCLKYGVWEKSRSKFAQSKIYGHYDALAALVYLVRNLNKSTNPIPVGFQVDSDNQLLVLRERQSDSAITLKNAFRQRR
jgi:hypothetical protein